ncbi:Kynurenine 3-monooxygenase [Madurella mycetomatis]|uniref:Kynurenine 3-monooxygenase n=1 Tax=Madurella mycetomatis TaxID=100816 RepID=A0A175W1I4_9PEZI|nr:Kynurenine 3-monooxygenase [Madurella mycetomatis]KXX82458.1 Kynurenine 3-monooxygenase [Madurella mycetomatis]
MSMPPPLRVLISGAGIAGPALAHWLTRLPAPSRCEITIVERHPRLRNSGQQIDLRGQGIDAMRRMGIEPAVRAHLVDEPGMQIINARGEPRAYFESNKTGKGAQGFSAEWEIMRGDLCDVLYQATEGLPGVKYVFGCSVESFTQEGSGGKVHVKLSDGREDEYDLLVGADGIGSRIRRQMFTDGRPDPLKPVGMSIAFYTIPPQEGDRDFATMCHLPGRRMITTRRDRPDCLRVYLMVAGEHSELKSALKHGTVAEQKEAWVKLFKHDMDSSWQMPRFLDGLLNSELADDFYTQELAQVRLDNWSNGNVVLLGDAAFCPSPITAMGTSVALVGAYVLAGEIARAFVKGAQDGQASPAERIPEALAAYEKTLRPFILDVQNVPITWITKILIPETSWGIASLQWVAWLAITLRVDKILTWLSPSDDRGSWKLPDYSELRA